MLTLIRGKAKKSKYMLLMHYGENSSVFIEYGIGNRIDIAPEDKECWSFDRSQSTYNNPDELKKDLLSMFHHIRNSVGHQKIYLYGNFILDEVDTVKDVAEVMREWEYSLVASIQDDNVPNGQIVIEEFY
jgi:hypothetical protein